MGLVPDGIVCHRLTGPKVSLSFFMRMYAGLQIAQEDNFTLQLIGCVTRCHWFGGKRQQINDKMHDFPAYCLPKAMSCRLIGPMAERLVLNKQIRINQETNLKLQALTRKTGLSESAVLRAAVAIGLEKLATGESNPFNLGSAL